MPPGTLSRAAIPGNRDNDRQCGRRMPIRMPIRTPTEPGRDGRAEPNRAPAERQTTGPANRPRMWQKSTIADDSTQRARDRDRPITLEWHGYPSAESRH